MDYNVIRVIAADDHPIVRAGARRFMEKDGFIDVVAEANSPEALMQALTDQPCEVAVIDLTMPGRQPDGLPMIAAVRRRFPCVKIVLFTMSRNQRLLKLAVSAGANCVVNKDASMDELPKAVIAATRGDFFVGNSLRGVLGTDPQIRSDGDASPQLTPREADVFRLLASNMSVTKIAAQHHLSVGTISNQKMSGMRKLGIANDIELHEFFNSENFAI